MFLLEVVLGAFLLGSIPFGYLIGRFVFRTDIRQQGSGNIGAMNALRTIGKGGAAAVLLLDMAKGFIPVFVLARADVPQTVIATAAMMAVLGHCFSPWLGFKGGKGVATSIGAIFALSWQAGIVSVLAWAVGALALTQYSSVGSILANVVSPFALYFFAGSIWYAVYGVFAAAMIVFTHRENIERLRTGTENPLTLFKKKA